MIEGFCSKCHKIWTLETKQGLCQWCGKLATCQNQRAQTLRSIKSRSKARKEQANHNGNGYDQLEGEWLAYYHIASKFSHKAQAQDREDLRQDIILRLAEVESNNGHKPFTEGGMIRVASYVVMEYWHNLKRQPTTLSLDEPIFEDGDGNSLELWETIADDKAIDLDAWLDAKIWLLGCKERLLQIAYKKANGKPLSQYDRLYLCRYRQKELAKAQKALMITI